jgi:glycosyltransferase involved in cell wall biosynthesis
VKVVQALGWYYPESLGGTEVYVAGLCQRLRAAGCDVLIAAPDPGGDAERNYVHDGVPVYRYPTPSSPTRAECQGDQPTRGAERFHRWLEAQRPDVVHCHTFVTGLGLAELQAAKGIGARVVVTTHSSSLGWICQRGTMMYRGERLCDGICRPAKCAACELQHRGMPRPTANVLSLIPPIVGGALGRLPGRLGTALGLSSQIVANKRRQAAMMETIDRFVLLTQWAFDAAAANGCPREKLSLNRLGLSQTNVIRKPGPQERPTSRPLKVGYLGRFDRIKGIFDFARAIVAAPKAAVQFEFRGAIRTDAERAVADELMGILRDDARATFAPGVPHHQVPEILASWDVACFPSLCVEGGPTAAIEAHAVGTPVIGTRIGGLAELVADGRNGRLVAPGDWRALSHALQTIADEPAKIDVWREQLPPARTMDEVAADYLALYRPHGELRA